MARYTDGVAGNPPPPATRTRCRSRTRLNQQPEPFIPLQCSLRSCLRTISRLHRGLLCADERMVVGSAVSGSGAGLPYTGRGFDCWPTHFHTSRSRAGRSKLKCPPKLLFFYVESNYVKFYALVTQSLSSTQGLRFNGFHCSFPSLFRFFLLY